MNELFDFFFKGNFFFKILGFLYALLLSWVMNGQVNEIPKYQPTDNKLYKEIIKMDSIYFTAYNQCDMKTQASLYHDNLEFYHDKGGVITSKKELLDAIEQNICNKVTRTLVEGSVEVYPIPDYGAVQIGYHKFFNNREPNQKSIPSKFIVLWKKEDKHWKITRVVSLH
ncbi:conserved protein of unknown function [Tenacibaculum sp. 190130A14a]|uniref:DUF4440 domain-containing protein n=1 Tax=Tenacibaculum polynesiense TaxID=3137857 RepID=A0ABM9PET8_9FLAO